MKLEEIKEKLQDYNNFQECILENITFLDFGTTVEIDFNYIWDDKNNIRQDLNKKKLVKLRFKAVDFFCIHNSLRETFKDNLIFLNWGFNEISLIKIEDNRFISKVNILWESERKIEIIFSEIEILE